MHSVSPGLWIVATPIGNYADLSPRAKEALSGADLVLAEDTRRARRLFRECGITVPKMLSFFEHNESERQKIALEALRDGQNVALMTDAGTPLMSDPGFQLVRACRESGIPVSPIPGPCAPVAALSAAGLPPIPFTFLGFLPRNAGSARELLESFALIPTSLVFFERKDRLVSTLELALEILGERQMAICRELTKTHEQFILGKLSESQNLARDLLGEITVIIGAPESISRTGEDDMRAILRVELDAGMKTREAARAAKPLARGWSVKEIYELAARMRKED